MDANCNPQICDFGLARYKNDASNVFETTGNLFGTPGYMAPELERKTDTSQEADIFALGCLMLEVCTP